MWSVRFSVHVGKTVSSETVETEPERWQSIRN